MASIFRISEIGALMGDPARANMLYALKDSDCASAGDLMRAANVAPSTASEHLAKLREAGLIAMTPDGRHRYYRLASDRVGDLLEGLSALADENRSHGPCCLREDEAALHARSCCDHLAGWLGVRLAEATISKGWVAHTGAGLAITGDGAEALARLGADPAAFDAGPRRPVTLCHDWSEGAFHLGGALGGALLQSFCARDWLRRVRGRETVRVTPAGRAQLRREFGVTFSATA